MKICWLIYSIEVRTNYVYLLNVCLKLEMKETNLKCEISKSKMETIKSDGKIRKQLFLLSTVNDFFECT